jgi:hypothetical protein
VRRVLRLAIWLTIVFCPLQQTAAQAFKSAKLIPLPTGAGYVLSADFNGDGIPDLVYAPATGSDISPKILLGNGDGSFGNPISTSLPAGYYGYFAIADVNNDGKPDLLVLASNLGIPLLEVLLGNGDGTFQAPISSTLPTGHGSNNPNYTEHMGIADFNGDGNLDLVLPDSSNPYTSILLGDGHGHFAVKSTFLDENRPGAVQVGDFNKDGKMDFVSYFAQSRTAAVYLGQGDGTFKPPTVYSGTNNIQTLVVKDINGDGNLDLVTIDLSDSLQILLGNGDGTFTQTSLGSEVPGGPFAYILDVQDHLNDQHFSASYLRAFLFHHHAAHDAPPFGGRTQLCDLHLTVPGRGPGLPSGFPTHSACVFYRFPIVELSWRLRRRGWQRWRGWRRTNYPLYCAGASFRSRRFTRYCTEHNVYAKHSTLEVLGLRTHPP